jgi:hypothetical protein
MKMEARAEEYNNPVVFLYCLFSQMPCPREGRKEGTSAGNLS